MARLLLLVAASLCVCAEGYRSPAPRRAPPRGKYPAYGPPGPFPHGEPKEASYESACALIIPGPGKSNALDHLFDRGGYDSAGTCITIESINQAFQQAKQAQRYANHRGGSYKKTDIGDLGQTILETTRIIAHQYGLSPDVVVNGLPLIDTRKTEIGEFCPDFLDRMKCEIKRYREYDGLCNNVRHPYWGATRTTYKRLLPPVYPDGISDFPISKTGHPLPSTRAVSAHVHRDEGFHDHAVTVMLIAWGQAIDHDITLAADTRDRKTHEVPKCCKGEQHPLCAPITIPAEDPFYSVYNQYCMNFVRSQTGVNPACKLGPRTAFNDITSVIDANWIYGSYKDVADSLRTFEGGFMKTLPLFKEYGLKDIMPLKTDDPDVGCIRKRKDFYCFLAGDARANEQLVLASVHILFLREHNIIATGLAALNPHWDDETLYQETRHIISAYIQHITYNEFLPMVLGKEVMQKYDLILQKDGHWDKYDDTVNPSASESFITASFRFGHSLLTSTVERWSKDHKYISSQRLSELLLQPYDLYKVGWCDTYILGLINQVAQAMDDSITQEVSNHLFEKPGNKYGLDLPALNMQRARDHGVPGYNDFREFCGLPRAHSFEDLLGHMPNHTVYRYTQIYGHVDDIDLFSGGVSERPLAGSMVGPTFACLIGLQFRDLRYGDRFWYENSQFPSSFTREQLNEIRKIKLSKIICDNADDIDSVQIFTMVLPDHEINPRVSCQSGILPRIDLSFWKDTGAYQPPGPHHGPPRHRPYF